MPPVPGEEKGAASSPLDQLEREATQLQKKLEGADDTTGADAPKPDAPLPLDREVAGMFAMIGAGLGAFLPSVKDVLSEPQCNALGQALAPLMVKYGMDRYVAGFAWRVEFNAAMVAIPVAIALRDAVRTDLANLKARAAAAGGDAPKAAPAAAPAAEPPGMLKAQPAA